METSKLKDKVCIVTGASSGLGKAAAKLLLQREAKVVMLSRDNERGQKEFRNFRMNYKEKVDWIPADLSSLKSIERFVESFRQKYPKLNFLFNCAGIILVKRKTTEDGLEAIFATNYLGHFYLTNLLYEPLKAASPSRVITVSGRGHKSSLTEGIRRGTVDLSDLQGEKHFSFAKASKQAVLAKIIFTYELSRRWKKSGIEACTVCPGLSRTNLVSHLSWYVRAYMAVRFCVARAQTAEKGAGHLIELALTDKNINGKYFEGSKKGLKEASSSDESYDLNLAEKLWAASEELVGRKFDY